MLTASETLRKLVVSHIIVNRFQYLKMNGDINEVCRVKAFFSKSYSENDQPERMRLLFNATLRTSPAVLCQLWCYAEYNQVAAVITLQDEVGRSVTARPPQPLGGYKRTI